MTILNDIENDIANGINVLECTHRLKGCESCDAIRDMYGHQTKCINSPDCHFKKWKRAENKLSQKESKILKLQHQLLDKEKIYMDMSIQCAVLMKNKRDLTKENKRLKYLLENNSTYSSEIKIMELKQKILDLIDYIKEYENTSYSGDYIANLVLYELEQISDI